MARIRSIKPEFPQSESMGRVSREARLCFVLLWTIADDAGRLRGSSRMLASLLYPYDDDAGKRIDGWLAELEAEGCLVRYAVEGNTYIEIANWLIHQRIDKPSQSKIPAFDESSRILANDLEDSRSLLVGREGKGKERKGKDAATFVASEIPGLDVPVWERWVAYRVALNKPIKPVSMASAARQLAAYGPHQAAAVEQSVASGWQGLQPLKGSPVAFTASNPLKGTKAPEPMFGADGRYTPEFAAWAEANP